ncbi:MAG: hypothetical protein K0U93_18630 [Gammaproteobacteria bacterium]|nr:hypothetical protein [Gammaproteobacteria bacterium]
MSISDSNYATTVLARMHQAARGSEDETESMSLSMLNVPAGWHFSAGAQGMGGIWTFTREQLEGLTLTISDSERLHEADVRLELSGANGTTIETMSVNLSDEAVVQSSAQVSELSFRVSGEHFEGAPKFVVVVNGEQVGGEYEISADHRAGEWETFTLRGDFGSTGPENVELRYINDKWGGHWTKDRNMLVDHMELNGQRYETSQASYERDWGSVIEGQDRLIWGGKLSWDVESAPRPAIATLGGEPVALGLDVDGNIGDVFIDGLPATGTLTAGTRDANGRWTVRAEDVDSIGVTMDPEQSGELDLRVSFANSDAILVVPMVVSPVADAPELSVAAATGVEDTPISIEILARSADLDGSEVISAVHIEGAPDGANFSAGTKNADGSWTLSAEDLEGLTILPGEHTDSDFSLTVTATSTETIGGNSATSVVVVPVSVDAVADAPIVMNAADHSSITFRLSGDRFSDAPEFSGPPEFFIYVDGVQVGGQHFATADIALGEWEEFTILGDWGATGPSIVEVEFTSDLWCAADCSDRDLLVDKIVVNNTPYEAEDAKYLRYAMNGD